MWSAVVLWLGLHTHGLHPGGDPSYLLVFHLYCHRTAEARSSGSQTWRIYEKWPTTLRNWPLHSNIHYSSVLFLHGPPEGETYLNWMNQLNHKHLLILPHFWLETHHITHWIETSNIMASWSQLTWQLNEWNTALLCFCWTCYRHNHLGTL